MPIDLSMFFDPGAVAVVGATDDVTKWGYQLGRGALAGSARRPVGLVNRRGGRVLGQAAARNLRELGYVPDLVVIAVPAGGVDAVVDEAVELGVRGFVAITAGLRDERALVARIRAAGARLIGPNCLGIHDSQAAVHLAAWGEFEPGPLAIVSQSGQLGLEIAGLAHEAGLGVSRFVSVGNQLDVNAVDVLETLVEHRPTDVIALYLESFSDGRALVATLAALRAAGKPTVLLTVGASDASRKAARSHTGSLTSALDLVDAACRSGGAVRVSTPTQLVDAVAMLARAPLPRGRRVAIVGDSGGQGAVAADIAAHAGLSVVPLPEDTVRRLSAVLPPHAGTRNPVDLAGAGEQDMTTYSTLAATLAECVDVDAVVLTGYFGRYGHDTPELAQTELDVVRRIGAVVADSGKPVVAHTMALDSPAVPALAAVGVATYHSVESALGALAVAARLAESQPATAGPGSDVVDEVSAVPAATGYLAARGLGEAVGVRFPTALGAETATEISHAARRLRAPYVLKADWLEHKTEHGGVAVGLPDAVALLHAYREMSARLGPGRYVVEECDTRPGVVEFIVGARHDPHFGAVVLVGAGGIHAELYADSTLELAPVDRAQAQAMLRRLTCCRVLAGWRGSEPIDSGPLADLVVAVSRLVAAHPSIVDYELNPVRVATDGALAVDALVTTTAMPQPQDAASMRSMKV